MVGAITGDGMGAQIKWVGNQGHIVDD